MKESKDHLKINLDFLDKKESLRVASKPKAHTRQTSDTSIKVPGDRKFNWKKILIIGGAIILIIIWLSSTDSSDTYTDTTNAPSSSNKVQVGDYWCSYSDANKADSLGPTSSEKRELEDEENYIETTGNALDREYVDEYNSYAVDAYNQKVNAYNSRLATYETMRVSYNKKVDAYNSYLNNHCSE